MERNKLLLTVYKDQFNIHFFLKKIQDLKSGKYYRIKGKEMLHHIALDKDYL